jgi:Cof subfamily protein (haloacid dehalogenase superfamily)
MIKLIVSDLDETLVGPDGAVSKANIEAIKKATAKGVKFVPNTGRGYRSVQPLLETLGLRGKANEYVISYNGGAIIENQNFKVMQTNALTVAQASQIFDVTKTHLDYSTHIYTLDQLYVYNEVPADMEYMLSRGVKPLEYKKTDLSEFEGQPIFKVITMNADAQKRQAIKDAVLEHVDFDLNATFSSERYTEFNLGGVDKGNATLELAHQLGIKRDEIMALGDNSNDVAMLKSVGMPVVMSNANQDARSAAKYVTEGNYTSGVAEAINRFVL